VNRSLRHVFPRPTSLYTGDDIGQLSGSTLEGRNRARPRRPALREAIAGRREGGARIVSTTLAERIDRLFRTYLSPRGREYTYREVAAAISGGDGARRNGEAISAAYVWGLRTGVKDNPTMRHLQALARFFEVSPSYFFDGELTEFPETDMRLLAASRRETLRRLAVTLLGLSEESMNAVLGAACRMRHLEALPTPN